MYWFKNFLPMRCVKKNDDILKEDIAQRFDADFLLMTQELSQLVELIAEEFGNIKGI